MKPFPSDAEQRKLVDDFSEFVRLMTVGFLKIRQQANTEVGLVAGTGRFASIGANFGTSQIFGRYRTDYFWEWRFVSRTKFLARGR